MEAVKTLHRFWDLQCNQYSAHTTIEGIAEMCIEDISSWANDEDKKLIKRFEDGLMSESEMRKVIENFEYKIKTIKLVRDDSCKKYRKIRIGSRIKFDGFEGTLVYLHGMDRYGILLEDKTVDFIKWSENMQEYLKWLEGKK